MGKMTKSTAKQVLAVCIPLVLTIGALLFGKVYPRILTFNDIETLWTIPVLAALILIGISAKSLGKIRLRFSPVVPVMLIFAVAVILYSGNSPQYDETLYYYKALVSAHTFDFSLNSVLDLAWHSHPMIPYALYITAGQTLFPSYVTVIVQNLLLSLVTIYCVYKLIIFYLGYNKKGRIFSAIGSAVFALSPIFITNCLCLTSDCPILVFLPIFLCAVAYDKKIVMFFSALCLLFSKLPGTALCIIIIGVLLFAEFLHTRKNKSGILKLIKNRLCLIIPLVIVAFYFIFFLKIWGDSLLSSSGSSDVPNCFTFDLRYIMLKLSQFFVFQFNWLLTAVIIIFGICLIARKRKKIGFSLFFEIKPTSVAIVVSFFAYLFYCVSYVTHAHIRYNNLSIFYLALFATVIFCKFCNIYYIRYTVFSIVSLLMLSSFFFNSDFVSNSLFASYDFTQSKLINTHAFSWENPQLDITDSVVYNSEFVDLNALYEKVHKQMGITSHDNIIHLNFSKWKLDFADSWKDGALSYNDDLHERTVALLNENGYPMPTCYYVAQREAVYDNFADFDRQYFIDSVATNPDLLPDEAVILLFPWQEDQIPLFDFYEINEQVRIEHNGFDVICLRVSK